MHQLASGASASPVTAVNVFRGLWATMRPVQWIKNVLVLAAVFFSLRLFDVPSLSRSVAGFVVFCLAASSIYILNDVLDRERDREHPEKRHRPIASGQLPIGYAWAGFTGLAASALVWAGILGVPFLLIIAGYIGLNVFYSTFGKHVVIIDVMIIATGLVLRVEAGTILVGVPPSKWLLICTIMLSLFLGFTKRKAELSVVERGPEQHRQVLSKYSPAFLDQMMGVATAGAVMSYVHYTLADETIARFGTKSLIYTVPIVIYAIYRYLYLTQKSDAVGNPVKASVKDPGMVVAVVLWVVLVGALIYLT